MRKRIKNFAIKYAIENIQKILLKHNKSEIIFKPDGLIYDACNKINKKIVSMTIKEVLSYIGKSDNNQDKRAFHNMKVLSEITDKEVLEILSMQFDEMYDQYLKSDRYEKDCFKILKEYGKHYLIKYRSVSMNFLQYLLLL